MNKRLEEMSKAVVKELANHSASHEDVLLVGTILVRYICDTHGISVKQTVSVFEDTLASLESTRKPT